MSIVGQGQKTAPSLDAGDGKDPPFRDPGEHDDHPVPLLHPVLEEHVGRRVREVHHLAEGVGLLHPFLVHPYHGEPVPVLQAQPIDHIEPEIEVFRDLKRECPVGLNVILHIVSTTGHMNRIISCGKFFNLPFLHNARNRKTA